LSHPIDINSTTTDALSPAVHEILALGGPDAYTQLVVHGDGNRDAAERLRTLTPEQVLMRPVISLSDARAILSGLWLWHDWLDSSHTISQELHTSTGSFWHAIMHRREGDFSNAKYWYDRCAKHPVLPVILAQVQPIVGPLPADKTILKLTLHGWNPHAFVDLVEQVDGHPDHPLHRLAVSLQQLEWRLLFDHTLRAATGTNAGVQFFTPEQHGGGVGGGTT
jgi:hypothetical protein